MLNLKNQTITDISSNEELISIIVLTYNHADFIAENMRGILMQQVHAEVELIISDDGSTDQTVQIIQHELTNAPANFKIKFFKQPKNLGATPNFYFALEQVTGNFVTFCEGDDYWTDPFKLQTQLDFMQQHPDCSLCFHTAVNISDDPKIHRTDFSEVEDRAYSTLEIYWRWIIHTATVMMRTDVLQSKAKKATMTRDDLQYFDTVLFMAASTVGKLYGISKRMSAYRRHDAGLSAGSVNYKRDLRHNQLDKIIGDFYGGEIKKTADWLIFSRSRINFGKLLFQRKLKLMLQYSRWLVLTKGNLKVYLIKKYFTSH